MVKICHFEVFNRHQCKKHIHGVHQLLAIPFSEDSTQFAAIFELGDSTHMSILLRGDGLTPQINNLQGNQHIIHFVHIIHCTM